LYNEQAPVAIPALLTIQSREMESKFRRLASRSRRADTPLPTTSPQGNQSLQSSPAANNEYNDGQLAQNRYKEAASRLKEVIKDRKKGPWDSFDLEEFSCEPEGFDDSQFKNKINAVLISREKSIKDRNGWAKFTYAVECVFTAFSPFAKNFLTVAANAQSVIPISPV
jgi:hypothetical protein